MEQQVLDLLRGTLTARTHTIRNSEAALLNLYPQPDFPFSLLLIAAHTEVDISLRKAALTSLKTYINATWSADLGDAFRGHTYLTDQAKGKVRDQLLVLCTTEDVDSNSDQNVQALAAGVTSRIASVDFPDAWPDLFQYLTTVLAGTSSDAELLGALRLLSEVVDSGFDEQQFFAIARDLINSLHQVASTTARPSKVRAMALSVFHGCFGFLEMSGKDQLESVKAIVDPWMSLLVEILRAQIAQPPSSEDEVSNNSVLVQWKGSTALKIQAVMAINKIHATVFDALAPHQIDLFQAVWAELSHLTSIYKAFFVDADRGARSTDADDLAYSLDYLVQEELDFLAACFRGASRGKHSPVPLVKDELGKEINAAADGPHTAAWLQELFNLLAVYASIPEEDEGMWEFDPNLYLSEITSVTANYTPRAAATDLAVRGLSEWLKLVPIDAVLICLQHQTATGSGRSKEREAIIFILRALLQDAHDSSKTLAQSTAEKLLQQISSGTADEYTFTRSATHLTLGSLFKVAGSTFHPSAITTIQHSIQAAISDASDVVRISCIKVIHDYLDVLPRTSTPPLQINIVDAVAAFVSSHDLEADLEESDDIKAALIETTREAILIDVANALHQTNALNIFFTLASNAATSNFFLTELVGDSFKDILEELARAQQNEVFDLLCRSTIPSLAGAFDVADMTQESRLTTLAATFTNLLAEHGSTPLPTGFVATIMPKLQRVLMEATEPELVRTATEAVTSMLMKDPTQFFSWHDPTSGKTATEVTLRIVDRLLHSPDVEESAADKVGELALQLFTVAGADQLGQYLHNLLQAAAHRLATASRMQFIQSLCMVFAGLSNLAPRDVVDFLSTLDINGHPALSTILPKWLENSIYFAGFEQNRQNTMALSKIYSLHDPRVKAVEMQGDLIIEDSDRPKTRSAAKLRPDRYSSISGSAKILKILVEDFSSACTSQYATQEQAIAAAEAAESESSDDGDDWEDVGPTKFIDLAGQLAKEELMGLENAHTSSARDRLRDDELAEYLMPWFRAEAQTESFQTDYALLNIEERETLQTLMG